MAQLDTQIPSSEKESGSDGNEDVEDPDAIDEAVSIFDCYAPSLNSIL